jgi:hypothetical protein
VRLDSRNYRVALEAMDWRVRFSVPCCSPRNPCDFAYFNKHVTGIFASPPRLVLAAVTPPARRPLRARARAVADILDFAHSERSSYNFLGRLRPIADFPGFSVIHAWKFPSL